MKKNKLVASCLLTGKWLLLLMVLFACHGLATAQDAVNILKGKVLDGKGEAAINASVALKGTTAGNITDVNGEFSITLPAGTTSGTIVVSYLGHTTREVTFSNTSYLTVKLQSTTGQLNDVVVIGYGAVKQKDLTGAVSTVGEKDFNPGTVATAGELIQGKAAGVVVTPNNGAPGAGTTINIRGINSINQTTQPLIVLDGVPLSRSSIAGAPDPLSTINPDDIESFTILKDAASCAIYGDRGSNGVILINTKRGKSGKLSVTFNSTTSTSQVTKYVDVMGAAQFKAYIESNPMNLPAASQAANVALLGNANTDWQKQIYQNALTTNNEVSLTGGIKNLPYRFSFANMDQEGILKTGYLKRQSASLNLTPSFFKNSLKLTVNVNATHSENRFANTGAIGDAIRFDPTQPVYSGNKNYDGYYTWLQSNGHPVTLATSNPVADLNDTRNISGVNRGIGNVQLEYALPSFPELRAVVNGGGDISNGSGYTTVVPTFAGAYNAGGTYDPYKQYNRNELLDAYLNYKKEFKNIHSVIDATAGYGYQDFVTYQPGTTTYYTPSASGIITPNTTSTPDSTEAVLLSYYARLIYTFYDKYIVSLSDREDYSSRIAGNHGGNFSSAAVAWKLNEENFLKNVNALSQLKLRASYGQTGNADISDYQYIPNYSPYQSTAQYQLGSTNYIPLAPGAYNTNIKWETVTGTDLAIDYGFLNNRITGTIDYYNKKTTNLLLYAPVPALANLSNEITQNIGNLTNKGIEFSISAIPVVTKDFKWTVNFNVAYNENKVTALYGKGSLINTGGISGGTANTIQADLVGQPVNSFYAYQQVYAANGAPIEGLYAAQKDGTLYYSYKSPNPTTTLGFSTSLNYKKWGLFLAMHGDFGNYVYNNVLSNLDTKNAFVNSLGYLANGSPDVLYTKFANSQYLSDYYIQNASFLRMDNITLSYNFGKIISHKVGLTVSAICQNAFVITKYKGVNPEIPGGIDNNVYPIPRVYSFGVKLNF
jgi:iron complex outermembrane receptor protein